MKTSHCNFPLKTILFIFLFFNTLLAFSQPTDNPYRTKYNPDGCHWTDSLPWTNVHNINEFSGSSWTEKLENAQNALTSSGGVIYFPAGTYEFSENMIIKDKIILRGATPTYTDARDSNYTPQTKFIFPKYIPSFSEPGNSACGAFKGVISDGIASNTGLVNITINRAFVQMQPKFKNVYHSGGYTTFELDVPKHNVIVFGCRICNTALPLKNETLPSNWYATNWQAMGWWYVSNIDALVQRNCVIANNRCNDYLTSTDDIADETYEQPGFVTFDKVAPYGSVVVPGWKAPFNYNDHYGICVNRFMTDYKLEGCKITGDCRNIDKNSSTPSYQSMVFGTGVEVLDNWVYQTMRCCYMLGGNGMVVRNNVGRNKPNKQRWVSQSGTYLVSFQAFLENRGLDFVGWNVTIEDNDFQVWNHKFETSQYSSNDGEGILVQACCGGGENQNYMIRNNKVEGPNAMISSYKTYDINNLWILNNNLSGRNIFVSADPNGGRNILSNVHILNNTNVGYIRALGTKGGNNCEVANNSGTGNIDYSCNVNVHDNIGMTINACSPIVFEPQTEFLTFNFFGTEMVVPNWLYNPNCQQNNSPAFLKINNKPDTVIIADGRDTINIAPKFWVGGADSVEVWVNDSLEYKAGGNQTLLSVNLPFNGRYYVHIRGKDYCSNTIHSNAIFVNKKCSNTVDISKSQTESFDYLNIYPNPTHETMFVKWNTEKTGLVKIDVCDISGRMLMNKTFYKNQNMFYEKLDFNHFNNGTYIVRISIGNEKFSKLISVNK